jgi:MYXO-CTERM domain-containing protein
MRHFRFVIISLVVFSLSHSVYGGTLYYSEDSNPNGLFTLNVTTGLATQVGSGISGVITSTVGLAPSSDPNSLFGSKFFDLMKINTDGSGSTDIGSGGSEGLGFDPNSDTLFYAINGSFGIQNQTNGARSPLASPNSDVEGLAYGDGGVYGLDTAGDLKFYDIGTGLWSTIGNTGLPTGFNKGLAYDPSRSLLYAISGQDSLLYSINPQTAASAVIGDTGRSASRGGLAFVGMQAPVPEPSTVAVWSLLGLGAVAQRRRKRNS